MLNISKLIMCRILIRCHFITDFFKSEWNGDFFVLGTNFNYRKRAIISYDLYIFYPISHCSLYCRAVSIIDNLCTKQGNSSILSLKFPVYNRERFQIMNGL